MSDIPGANYSRLDRLLHRAAFSSLELQKSLADIEDRMHAKQIAPVAVENPVFITALPRAGTTLLLDVLVRNPYFVAHTYRCMPFVLCPILWDSISRGFRRPGVNQERAHGDGMSVSFDSPEAFEEVLWMAFWSKKYQAGRIDLWTEHDRDAEFEQFLLNHIKKMIALNLPKSTTNARYISKNNANIARIPLLRKIFPDGAFVTPFRDPVNHAASLLHQHTRFLKMHAEDPFSRRYMDDIGHFEFGTGLRTIAFPGKDETGDQASSMTGNYWLAYWMRAYSFLAENKTSESQFIDFDRLCSAPQQSLTALSNCLKLPEASDWIRDASLEFRPAVSYDAEKFGFDPPLLARAKALHEELLSRALN